MADKHTLARPYAVALFDLARNEGRLDQWSLALSVAAMVAEDERVLAAMQDPKHNDADRLRLLTGLFGGTAADALLGGSDREGTNFLKLLVENDRVEVLPEVAELYEQMKAEAENTLDVTVTSAAPLTDDLVQRIRGALQKKLGREVNLSTAIDEGLIGGAVIRAGDFVIDGSVRSRLGKLASVLSS